MEQGKIIYENNMTIIFNNKVITKNQAVISIFSEALMFGFGVFETLRTYNKKPFKAKEHIKRMFNSAEKIKLKIKYNEEEILKMINEGVKKQKNKNQKIKIIGLKEGIYIICENLKIDEKIYKNGYKLKTCKIQRNMPEVKSISYLESYIAYKEAQKNKYDEALLISKNGEVYEGAHSNIFWFEKDTLCTRKNKVLKGITRETVLKINPYKIKYKKTNIKNLTGKREIFITKTTTGITPVTQINNKKMNEGKPGKKTEILIKLFNDYCEKA